MSLRLLEINVREESSDTLEDWPGDRPVIDCWRPASSEPGTIRALVDARDAEEVVDELVDRLGEDNCRIVSLPVEATVPRVEEDEEKGDEAEDGEAAEEESRSFWVARVSREELYEDLGDSSTLTPLFMLQVALSTIVACVGLLRGDTAVVVGAMVIAPLLGPNVALGFGATLGDLTFIRRSLVSNVSGVALASAIALSVGATIPVDPTVDAIATRIQPGFGDVVLALAAGVAGTLAVTSGAGTALIGVMVAVALLPPLAVAGMLAGGGFLWQALGAATLVGVNVICVNLASVGTFVLLGVRPRAWWQQEGAHRSSRAALLVWAAGLLLILMGLLAEWVLQ